MNFCLPPDVFVTVIVACWMSFPLAASLNSCGLALSWTFVIVITCAARGTLTRPGASRRP